MAAKRFLFGTAGRARLLEGSRILAGAVKPTLGPGGRNILLERPMHGAPLVTKDGVTVAEEIELRESFANMGAQLVLESAVKTGNTAGDGTTTATVLAHASIARGRSWSRRAITRSRSSAASTSASSASSRRWRRCRSA